MDFKKQHAIHGDLGKAEDLRSLEQDLRGLLQGKLEGKEHLQALNLACGRADETGVLSQLVGEKAQSAHIQGVDIREAEIMGANALWKPEVPEIAEGVEVDFHIGRGDQLGEWKELESKDLVFIRHQNYWFDPKAWVKLYEEALKKLTEDGVMVITSYFDEEHAMARRVLEKLGAVEVEHRFKPQSRVVKDSPKVLKTVDRHISVFVKV